MLRNVCANAHRISECLIDCVQYNDAILARKRIIAAQVNAMPGPAALSVGSPQQLACHRAENASIAIPTPLLPAAPCAVADWSPVRVLYIGWPSRPDVWRSGAGPARASLGLFARAAAAHVSVVVVADSRGNAFASAEAEFVGEALEGRPAIQVMAVDMDDCWLRDTGPIFCLRSAGVSGLGRREGKGGADRFDSLAIVAVSFDFNAWGGSEGGCYSDFQRDKGVGRALARLGGLHCSQPSFVLEGGSISCDGLGTILTTDECLIDGNRNRGVDRATAEKVLAAEVGARKVIWLPFGAARDDDTNGHVDNMCVFLAPGHVLLHWADAMDDAEQHRRSALALKILQASVDARGEALRVHKVTAPKVAVVRSAEESAGVSDGGVLGGNVSAKARVAGERLAASYVNVVFAEDALLVPSFGVCDEDDARARSDIEIALASARSSGVAHSLRTVVQVAAREFVLAGGGLHCLSTAEPESGPCSVWK